MCSCFKSRILKTLIGASTSFYHIHHSTQWRSFPSSWTCAGYLTFPNLPQKYIHIVFYFCKHSVRWEDLIVFPRILLTDLQHCLQHLPAGGHQHHILLHQTTTNMAPKLKPSQVDKKIIQINWKKNWGYNWSLPGPIFYPLRWRILPTKLYPSLLLFILSSKRVST